MSSTLDNYYSLSEVTTSGHIITLSVLYTDSQKKGIWVLVAAAGSSLFSVLVLLTLLAISAYKTLRTPSEHRFMRTHVVAYFISLLLCDAIAAVGSLMNANWISRGGVFLDTFCTSQGALKNTGNIGTALWSMVISIHTFCLLFLKWRSREYTLYATLFVVWSFIGLVVLFGQTSVQDLTKKGPYFGVSGYWCWITDGYTMQRVTLEYFWMFLSVLVSILLYTTVFLSLRGNLVVSGGRLRLRFRRSSPVWESQLGKYSPDGHVIDVAKQMLAYPIVYCALVLPIAICRFLQWAGHEIPFEATVFADAVFLLSGLVNAILFTATRRIIPTHGVRELLSRSKATGSDIESPNTVRSFVMPFTTSEKIIAFPTEREQEVPVMPVAFPAPAVQKPPSSSRGNIKSGVSLTPTVSSAYSQSPRQSDVALPPLPIAPSSLTVPQPIVLPLNVARKFSLHKAPADVPVEVTEWSPVDVNGSSYSSHHSTSPLASPLPHILLSTRPSHSKAISSLTPSQRSPALGNQT